MTATELNNALNYAFAPMGDGLTFESCELASARIDQVINSQPAALSEDAIKLPNWVLLLTLIQEGIQFFAKNLYDQEKKYKKPNIFIKIRFGGYAIILLAKIILLFSKG